MSRPRNPIALAQKAERELRADRDLWKQRTHEGARIIEENVAEIARLRAEIDQRRVADQHIISEAVASATKALRAATAHDQSLIADLLRERTQAREQIESLQAENASALALLRSAMHHVETEGDDTLLTLIRERLKLK